MNEPDDLWGDTDFAPPPRKMTAAERRARAAEIMQGLRLEEPTEPAEVIERRERETKQRLACHDVMFGLTSRAADRALRWNELGYPAAAQAALDEAELEHLDDVKKAAAEREAQQATRVDRGIHPS